MSLTDTDVKIRYSANGSNDTFAINFDYVSSDQVSVYTVDESTDPPTETLKTITTHYTISGGNVVFLSAPASGLKVLLIRASSFVQNTDYSENSAFPVETEENALDYLTYLAQELKEMLSRAALLRKSTSISGPLTLPDPEAGQVLAWNSDADDLENVAMTDGNYQAATSTIAEGATSKSITLGTAFTSTDYSIVACLSNVTDSSPMFQPVTITARSTTGFTAKWNDALDSANYKLSWIAIRNT